MDKENVIDIHITKYYLVIQKKEILPFVTTWIKLESVMLSEERQIIYDLTCGKILFENQLENGKRTPGQPTL